MDELDEIDEREAPGGAPSARWTRGRTLLCGGLLAALALLGLTALPALLPIPPATASAYAVGAGRYDTCAIQLDESVRCFGDSRYGRLAGRTTASSSTPAAVRDLADAMAADASGYDTCALRRGGGAVCWGRNVYGTIGDGTRADALRPAPLVGLQDAASVGAGNASACARRPSGSVMCWGVDRFGALGDADRLPTSARRHPRRPRGSPA
jgi:alpha-tubulin suppressor-like RCC1 family protein